MPSSLLPWTYLKQSMWHNNIYILTSPENQEIIIKQIPKLFSETEFKIQTTIQMFRKHQHRKRKKEEEERVWRHKRNRKYLAEERRNREKKVKAKREREWKTKQMKRREAQAWAYFEDAYFNVNVGECSVLYVLLYLTTKPDLFEKIKSNRFFCVLELNCGVFSLFLEFDATFPPQLFGVGTWPYSLLQS